MVDHATNSLLLLYDDAQSIYERARNKQFSFKSVGVQAQGRTTILKINYRNTRQILQTASLIAAAKRDGAGKLAVFERVSLTPGARWWVGEKPGPSES